MIDETKRIVEWLRELSGCVQSAVAIGASSARVEAFEYIADAIERGDHLKDKTE